MIITLLVVIVLIIFAIKFFVENWWWVSITLCLLLWIVVILFVGFLGFGIFSGKTETIPVEEKNLKCVETISVLKYETSDTRFGNFLNCYCIDEQEIKIIKINRINSKILHEPNLSYSYLEMYEITGFKHWWTYIYAFPLGEYCVVHLTLSDSD